MLGGKKKVNHNFTSNANKRKLSKSNIVEYVFFKKVLYIKDKYMINKYRINIYYLMIYRNAEIRTLEVKENVTDIGVKL